MNSEKTVDLLKDMKVKIMLDIVSGELENLIRHVELGEVTTRRAITESARRGMELAKAIYR